MKNIKIIAIFTTIIINTIDLIQCIDLDNFRNAYQLIESRGFQAQTHRVFTSDGYILNVFRIINPYALNTTVAQRPVILWHGVTNNCDCWLISAPGLLARNGTYIESNHLVNDCQLRVTSNLAFTLSACGYDVWLPNTRGTEYSRGHQTMDSETSIDYWKYSFTELGIYDVRAVVEYVLKATNKASVAFIGHSLGAQSLFVLLSLQPEFERYVKPFIALAPFVFMSNMTSALRLVTPFESYLRSSPGPLGIPVPIAQLIGIFICGNQYFVDFCADFFYAMSGLDENNFNTTRIPIYVSHTGRTFSTWIFAHIAQLVRNGGFSLFDYGSVENMDVYNQANPPDYPLFRITSKNIAIFYALNDLVADISDVNKFINSLKVKLLDNYLIPYPQWAHQDYTYGTNAGFYMNTRILQLLKIFLLNN